MKRGVREGEAGVGRGGGRLKSGLNEGTESHVIDGQM